MSRPRLLDLFCGAGGAAMGYYRAGFDVVGVDIKPQPHYPFEFVETDALAALAYMTRTPDWSAVQIPWEPFDAGFDVIHASPPCQPYSRAVTSRSSRWNDTLGKDEPALIEPVRALLRRIGLPYVIENVEGAPLDGITLCGTMFGLDIPRHRIFESSAFLFSPWHPKCDGVAKRAAARRGWEYRDMSVTGKGRRKGTSERWSELLGVDWPMRQHDLKEAIPPAYTEWIGAQLLRVIEGAA